MEPGGVLANLRDWHFLLLGGDNWILGRRGVGMTDIISWAITITVLFFAGPFILNAVAGTIEKWRDLLRDLSGK